MRKYLLQTKNCFKFKKQTIVRISSMVEGLLEDIKGMVNIKLQDINSSNIKNRIARNINTSQKAWWIQVKYRSMAEYKLLPDDNLQAMHLMPDPLSCFKVGINNKTSTEIKEDGGKISRLSDVNSSIKVLTAHMAAIVLMHMVKKS